ncbi:hypothetical protein AMTRI_Chr08g165080 [Amborella trichopoda]
MEEAFTENSHEQDNNIIQRIVSQNISYSGRSIVNWNIDGLSEQQILDTMKHMTMYAFACKMVGNHDQEVAKAIVCGFTGWLRGWWDFHLPENTKQQILNNTRQWTVKNENNQDVLYSDSDAVNTLIYTITLYFVGSTALLEARSEDLLSNLRLKTRLKNKNGGIIPYSVYTLGELSAEICAKGLALCTDMKLKKQLDKQKMTGKKELGDFLKIVFEEEYNFQTLALVDSGADLNCINEGLVPSKYFDKTTQILNTADGSRLFIKYKLSNAMVCNNGHCFPTPFIMEHTQAIKKIKIKAKELPCLNLANPNAFKIIECDASELGLGEILSIVHCVTKFQSDILNTRFLIRTDCKAATDILTKDVQNVVSKQIFARWQVILSSFDRTLKREWYEMIQVETESISLVHYNQKNSKIVAYSKLQIRKVLSFEDWGSDPSKAKRIYSPDFPNKYYRHADYIDVWHKILTLQNPYNSHTWFLQFKMPINTPFPNWFRNWFATWGSLTQILPEPLQLSQNRFIDFNGSDPNIDYHLYFIAMYQVPWIVKWNFVISPNNTNNFEYIPCLGKQIAIKWWDVFVYLNIEPDNIQLKRIPLAYGSHSYSNPNSLAEYITIMKKQNPRATKEELEKQLPKIFEEEAETARTPSTPEIEIPLDTPDPSGHGMSQKHTLY